MSDIWTDERLEALVDLRAEKLSFERISSEMQSRFGCAGLTKNACLSKYRREFPDKVGVRADRLRLSPADQQERRRLRKRRKLAVSQSQRRLRPSSAWMTPKSAPNIEFRCDITALGTPGVCRRCRYIVSGPPSALYCGNETEAAGMPWCSFHADMVYEQRPRGDAQ